MKKNLFTKGTAWMLSACLITAGAQGPAVAAEAPEEETLQEAVVETADAGEAAAHAESDEDAYEADVDGDNPVVYDENGNPVPGFNSALPLTEMEDVLDGEGDKIGEKRVLAELQDGGYYYLNTGNLKFAADDDSVDEECLVITNEIYLDLQGNNIIGNGKAPVIRIDDGGCLHLYNSSDGRDGTINGAKGYITGGGAGSYVAGSGEEEEGDTVDSYAGGGIVVDAGELIMYGGTIFENNVCLGDESDEGVALGGGVYVTGGGKFTMYNGSIHDNTAYTGGGVCNDGGEVNILGGKIFKNTATEGAGLANIQGTMNIMDINDPRNLALEINENIATASGGGILAREGDEDAGLRLYAGTIRGNKAPLGAGVYMDDKAAIMVRGGDNPLTITGNKKGSTENNIELSDEGFLKFSEKSDETPLYNKDSKVGITMPEGKDRFTDGWVKGMEYGNSAVFKSDADTTLDAVLTLTDELNFGKGVCSIVKPGGGETKLESFYHAVHNRSKNNDTVKMLQDVVLDGASETEDNAENVSIEQKNIILDLNGHTLDSVSTEGTIILSAESDAEDASETPVQASLVIKDSAAELDGGKTGMLTSQAGAGVTVGDQCSLTLHSGTISGCTDSAVKVMDSGEFTMNGGFITKNSSAKGAGVYVDAPAAFVLNDGNIEGNTATESGGGVYVLGEFTMNGGSIVDNLAGTGAGICVEKEEESKSSVRITGGLIKGNKADSDGGGIYAGEETKLELASANINGNTAEAGAGIYAENADIGIVAGTTGYTVVIDNNVNTDGLDDNLNLAAEQVLKTRGTLSADSRIGITLTAADTAEDIVFTDGWMDYNSETPLSVFKSDYDNTLSVKYMSGELCFGQTAAVLISGDKMTSYTSINEAIAAAGDGDVVKICDTVAGYIEEALVVDNEHEFIIDLDGNTIATQEGAPLTVKKGAVVIGGGSLIAPDDETGVVNVTGGAVSFAEGTYDGRIKVSGGAIVIQSEADEYFATEEGYNKAFFKNSNSESHTVLTSDLDKDLIFITGGYFAQSYDEIKDFLDSEIGEVDDEYEVIKDEAGVEYRVHFKSVPAVLDGVTLSVTRGADTVTEGSPQVGDVVKAVYTPSRISASAITYSWHRKKGTDDQVISGATAATYTITADDVGYVIYASVKQTVEDGDPVTVDSEPTGEVIEKKDDDGSSSSGGSSDSSSSSSSSSKDSSDSSSDKSSSSSEKKGSDSSSSEKKDDSTSSSSGSVSEDSVSKNAVVAKQKVDLVPLALKKLNGKAPAKWGFKILNKAEKKVASVNGKGILKAKKSGKVTVTVYDKQNDKKATKPLTTLEINIVVPVMPKVLDLKTGETKNIFDNIKGAEKAPDPVLSLKKPGKVELDAKKGDVKGVAKGSAVVMVNYGEGKNAAKYKIKIKVQ